MNLYIDITDKKKIRDIILLFDCNQIRLSANCRTIKRLGYDIDGCLTFVLENQFGNSPELYFPSKDYAFNHHKATLVPLSVMVKAALKY